MGQVSAWRGAAQKWLCVTEISLRAPGQGRAWGPWPSLEAGGEGRRWLWSNAEGTRAPSAPRKELPLKESDLLSGADGAQNEAAGVRTSGRQRVERAGPERAA